MAQQDPMLGIAVWAKNAWEDGSRETSHEMEANAFLRAALASSDPHNALFDAVDTAMATALHNIALTQEREMGSWDNPADKAESAATPKASSPSPAKRKGTPSPYVKAKAGGMTPQQKRQLTQVRWTATRGKIVWSEITVADIDATIAHFEKTKAGIDKSIEFFRSAKRLIVAAGVETLGEVTNFNITDYPEPEED